MAINRDIPGQLNEEEMQAIEALASLVPQGGTMVEVGSLLGLSSWILAKSAPPSANLHCFDPWELDGASGNFNKLAAAHGQTFSLAQFTNNIAGCPNVHPHRGYSPRDFTNWNKPIDLYFEDSVHANPILNQNLTFWTKHLERDGIVCGHDYSPRFSDVQSDVDQLAKLLTRTVRVIGTLWFLLPDNLQQSQQPHVRKALRKLHDLEAWSRNAGKPGPGESGRDYQRKIITSLQPYKYRVDVEPTDGKLTVQVGRPIIVRGKILNQNAAEWPVIVASEQIWEVGAELYTKPDGKKISVGRDRISEISVKAGQSIDFTLQLPTLGLSPGPAHLMIAPLFRHLVWFHAAGSEPAKIAVELVEAPPGP